MSNAPEQKRDFAWQPLTPKGVSKFARASFGRLLFVQFIFAVAIATALMWFVYQDYFPVVRRAIRQLPPRAEIRHGHLQWGGDSPALLAEGRFLAISVDLKHEGQARSPAHVAIELGERDYKLFSLLGYERRAYPTRWRITLTPSEAEPWWGAWSPVILAGVAGVAILAMMLSWALLSFFYCIWIWLIAFFANRALNLRGSWCLCGAAQMPGVALLIAAIFCHGIGWIDLIHFALAAAIHLVIAWGYLIWSVFKLPVHPQALVTATPNPFAERNVPPASPEFPGDEPPPNIPPAEPGIESSKPFV